MTDCRISRKLCETASHAIHDVRWYSYLVNVPKLKGRENFCEWSFAAENFLILEGMKHCVKPVAEKKIENGDDEKTKANFIRSIFICTHQRS